MICPPTAPDATDARLTLVRLIPERRVSEQLQDPKMPNDQCLDPVDENRCARFVGCLRQDGIQNGFAQGFALLMLTVANRGLQCLRYCVDERVIRL
jgi:hypothetical protein